MFQFRYVVENEEQGYTAKRSITMDVESEATIDEMLEAFQDFLTGAGYVIDPLHQKIMLVKDEDGAF